MIDAKIHSVVRVAELKSVTRAAEELSLTQPAVTQHIRSLENELGKLLFVRGRNEMTLTKEGEIFVRAAKRIIAIYENMRFEIRNEEHMLRSLTIGLTHTAESNSIVETLALYATKENGFPVRIVTDVSKKLHAMLRNYEVDFIIAKDRGKDEFESRLLDKESLVLAVSPEHPLANATSVTISALRREKMILRHQGSDTMLTFSAALENKNMRMEDLNVIMELENISTIKELVEANMGVSVLTKSSIVDDIRKKRLVAIPITDLSVEWEVRIFHHEDFNHPEVLDEIINIYEKVKNGENRRLSGEVL